MRKSHVVPATPLLVAGGREASLVGASNHPGRRESRSTSVALETRDEQAVRGDDVGGCHRLHARGRLLVSEKPTTLELHELSLALDTPDGVILVVGCSHPGIDRIAEAVVSMGKRIHLIVGGFHLVVAKDPEIDTIVTGLRDRWKVAFVAPGHCTGEPTFAVLRRAFGDRYLYAGLGTTLELGTRPAAVAGAVSAVPP